ncbi:DUF222 domain-containing protein [uncultured Friedmanniella sp.]|uniref:DUF222 domain-containing protein n=1 Tax=uncultured Friedmanniella sp. TaxID=335381 RepID=UPI0035CBBA97
MTGLFGQNHTDLMRVECRVLSVAVAWADAHEVDADAGDYQPLVERACAWGGDGTPAVSEFCASELGALQGTGMVAARSLIADALDVRYRLPRLWAQVQAGQVRGWQARKIAELTRPLSWAAAADVDEAVTGYLGVLPWPRFENVLVAAIVDADPEQAVEREQRAKTERGVWAGRTVDGLRSLIARASQGDVAWFMAMVDRIADILAVDGDLDPVGARRSKAVGILAQPAVALQLLIDHQHDQPAPDQPTEPEPELKLEPEPEPEPEPAAEPEDGYQSVGLTALPAGTDLSAARPRVVLTFHLNEVAVRDGHGLVRPDQGGEAWTLAEFTAWLTGHGCHVTVRPVLDPALVAAVDSYETPTRMRAAMAIRHPADVFPYGVATTAHLDLDHTIPYRPRATGGPPGQTSLANLGPLSRSSHRAVTHGGWRRRQPEPGRYLFRSPTGFVYLVTNQGTLPLGRSRFADQVWCAAAPSNVSAA